MQVKALLHYLLILSNMFMGGWTMRVLICDDHEQIRHQIEGLIMRYFEERGVEVPEIQGFSDGIELLNDEKNKDIVFLDIEMPGMDGIRTGQQLMSKNGNMIIIMITSHNQFLDDAMRFRVFRYLSKPIDEGRFNRNLQDALRQYALTGKNIVIETREGVYRVSSDDIILCEARARKVLVHTKNGTYESLHNLEYWLMTLNANSFVQPHRSFIVNMRYITEFNHSSIKLYHNQYEAFLTRRKYQKFKNAYLRYIETIG